MVAAVSGKRGRRYLKRQHLLELGADAIDYITELRHRRPRLWTSDIDKLHELLTLHGDAAMQRAFTLALAAETYGPEYVAHHLGDPDRVTQMSFPEVTQ